MFLSLAFAIISVLSLWPYLVLMGVLNFKKSTEAMEDHLPGRPARRTIGRKNDDTFKSVRAIGFCYLILCGLFYGMPELRKFMSDSVMIACVAFISGVSIYAVTPYNRLAHAYMAMGQLSVIHLCCALSAFVLWSALLHNDYLNLIELIKLSVLIAGVMLIFSRKQVEI